LNDALVLDGVVLASTVDKVVGVGVDVGTVMLGKGAGDSEGVRVDVANADDRLVEPMIVT